MNIWILQVKAIDLSLSSVFPSTLPAVVHGDDCVLISPLFCKGKGVICFQSSIIFQITP